MQRSQGSRKIVLVILLLAFCYGADWTNDNYSYWVAARWHAFQTANGPAKSVSGGETNDYTTLLAGTESKLKASEKTGSKQAKDSALASVFGEPLNGGSDNGSEANADTNNEAATTANSRLSSASRISRMGSLGGAQGGFSGSTGFGISFGQMGFSGMSGQSSFASPR